MRKERAREERQTDGKKNVEKGKKKEKEKNNDILKRERVTNTCKRTQVLELL